MPETLQSTVDYLKQLQDVDKQLQTLDLDGLDLDDSDPIGVKDELVIQVEAAAAGAQEELEGIQEFDQEHGLS